MNFDRKPASSVLSQKTPESLDSIAEKCAKEHREDIARIEHLNCGPKQRVAMMLVLLGAKPASVIELTAKAGEASPEDIQKTLLDAGLFVSDIQTKNRSKTEKGLLHIFLVSRNAEAVGEYRQLQLLQKEHGHMEEFHERFGRLVGIPQTAIDAFLKRTPRAEVTVYDLDPNVIWSFALSAKHREEELAVIQNLSRLIKKYTPNLFKPLCAEAHRFPND